MDERGSVTWKRPPAGVLVVSRLEKEPADKFEEDSTVTVWLAGARTSKLKLLPRAVFVRIRVAVAPLEVIRLNRVAVPMYANVL